MQTKLKISQLVNNTGQIKDVPANPRQIKQEDYKKLIKSLTEDPDFMEHKPLHVYQVGEEYVVLGGNQRLRALKELKYKDVPVTIYKPETPPEVLRARIMKDNAEFGSWDMDMLANEWSDYDLDGWGVDLPDDWQQDEQEVVEDEAPEVDESEPPKSKLGEIYQLGRHFIMCADSTVKENVDKLMDGNKADMVFTDPPYGIDLDTDNTKISGGWAGVVKGATNKKYSKVINDNIDYDATHIFRDFDYVKEIFLWGANYFANTLPNLTKSSWIVWDKTNDSTIYTIGSEFELLWSKQKHRQEIIKTRWAGAMGTETQDTKKRIHPTQKPLECLIPIINKYSGPKALIIDLFLGSGSTMVACHQTGRTCYAAEIDPRYVDVSIKRMLKLDPSLELKCNGKIIDKTPWLA